MTLTVSDGPGSATVPDVEGLRRCEARKALRDAGFKIERASAQPTTTSARTA